MIRLMGKIVDNGQVVGYAVLDMDSNKAAMCNIQTTMTYVHTIGCVNADIEQGKIHGTEASLNRLPEFDTTGRLIDKPKVSIIGNIEKGGEIVGFFIVSPFGVKKPLSYSNAITAIEKFGCTNAKLVPRDGKIIISAIQGTFETFNSAGNKVDTVVEYTEEVKPSKGSGLYDWGTYETLSKNNDFVFRNCSFDMIEKAKNSQTVCSIAFPQSVKISKTASLREIAELYGGSSYSLLKPKDLGIDDLPRGFRIILVDEAGNAISKLEHKLIVKALMKYTGAKERLKKTVGLSRSSKSVAIESIYNDKINNNACKDFAKEIVNNEPSILTKLHELKMTCTLGGLNVAIDSNHVKELLEIVESPADFIGNQSLYEALNTYTKWDNAEAKRIWGTVNVYELYDITRKQINTIVNYLLTEKIQYHTKPRIGMLMEAYQMFGNQLPIIKKLIDIKEVDGITTYTEKRVGFGNNLSLNDLVIAVYLGRVNPSQFNGGMYRLTGRNSGMFKSTVCAELLHAMKTNSEAKEVIEKLVRLDSGRVLKEFLPGLYN